MRYFIFSLLLVCLFNPLFSEEPKTRIAVLDLQHETQEIPEEKAGNTSSEP